MKQETLYTKEIMYICLSKRCSMYRMKQYCGSDLFDGECVYCGSKIIKKL